VASGSAGQVAIGGAPTGAPLELTVIGPPDKLIGSLTRSGGIIAQLAATQPDVTIEVTPVEGLRVPATTHDLVPAFGRPRL
jgi:uncharacterized protein YlxW (UPF0749 family)